MQLDSQNVVRYVSGARFRRALLLVLLASLALPVAASPRTLLVLGDSLSAAYGIDQTQGWVSLLDSRIQSQGLPWQVVNASLSGETTGGGLARLPQLLATHQPQLVIVELGGNDALRGYPLSQIRANLADLVRLSQDSGAAVLLAGIEMPPNYNPRNPTYMRDLYAGLAQSLDVPLVPFLLEDVALEPRFMQADGIHPTAAAQPILLDNVWPVLAPLLRDG